MSEPLTKIVVNTPLGKPDSLNISCNACAHWGTFDACFKTNVLPAIIAGAAARIACQKGKFHGITARITPSGSWRR